MNWIVLIILTAKIKLSTLASPIQGREADDGR
jgi:hypothetical protein